MKQITGMLLVTVVIQWLTREVLILKGAAPDTLLLMIQSTFTGWIFLVGLVLAIKLRSGK